MPEMFHRKLERSAIGFVLAIIAAASVGGIVEIAPLFTIDETVEEAPDMRVYTPLELAGRNIYVREGCYACHSQMIRTLRDEVERYGPYSLAVESKYDRPMLWGSKRTGPDLARVGGKYSDAWHVAHLTNPRDVVPESNMPAYAFLARTALRTDDLPDHLRAQRALGVPYTDEMIENAAADAYGQAAPDSGFATGVAERYGDATEVSAFDGVAARLTEMDALVAYLQVLGRLTEAAYENTAAPQEAPDPND
jgi:cytochrome c oxidase cbb3-type subunit 2